LYYYEFMTIEQIKKIIVPILKRSGVKRAAVFGSVARGEARPDSDIDILVEIPLPYGLFEFIDIKQSLEDALGKKIDLVDYQGIKPRIKESILQNQVQIL